MPGLSSANRTSGRNCESRVIISSAALDNDALGGGETEALVFDCNDEHPIPVCGCDRDGARTGMKSRVCRTGFKMLEERFR